MFSLQPRFPAHQFGNNMQNRRNSVYIVITVSLLIGLFTGRAFFFNLAYMMVGLVVLSFLWSWTGVRWLAIARRTRSSRAQVGRHIEEAFMVRNRTLIPKLWLEVRDHSDLQGHYASQVVPVLGARSTYRWHVRTLCTARGEFQLGPLAVTSGDPFGLFVSTRHIAATSRLLVYPAVYNLSRFNLPIGMLSGGDAQRRRSHYVTTNAAGVRDYVPGDSFNRIHWRSSARKDRLIVKEFEIDPLVDVWIFSDFSAASLVEAADVKRVDGDGPIIASTTGLPASTEEYVASISATLMRYFVTLDRVVGFAAYTPNRDILQPDRGSRQLTRALESLAVARSKSTYTFAQMLILETPYLGRGTTLITVTSSTDSEWIREAQILSQRGISVVCVFVDPTSFRASVANGDTIDRLRLAGIPTVVVKKDDDVTAALESGVH